MNKPIIKIPFEDYKNYAIKGMQEIGLIDNRIDPASIEFKITRHDGDRNIAELPDFVELEINLIKL